MAAAGPEGPDHFHPSSPSPPYSGFLLLTSKAHFQWETSSLPYIVLCYSNPPSLQLKLIQSNWSVNNNDE